MGWLRMQRSRVRHSGVGLEGLLGPGRHPQLVRKPDRFPFYPVNKPGEPRVVWPTLLCGSKSFAFRGQGAGTICNDEGMVIGEPSTTERELAMGFTKNTTTVAGVTDCQ